VFILRQGTSIRQKTEKKIHVNKFFLQLLCKWLFVVFSLPSSSTNDSTVSGSAHSFVRSGQAAIIGGFLPRSSPINSNARSFFPANFCLRSNNNGGSIRHAFFNQPQGYRSLPLSCKFKFICGRLAGN
jgi:hypothetical protein